MSDKRALVIAGGTLILAVVVLFGLLPALNGWLSTASTTPAAQRVHVGVPAPTGHPTGCYGDVEDCFTPVARPAHTVIYDWDKARGDQACSDDLRGVPLGSSCMVRPVNFDTKGGPGIYTEFDDDYQRGVKKCLRTLEHDRNPAAVCEVRSNTVSVAGEVAKG